MKMRKFFNAAAIAVLLSLPLIMVSCSNDDDDNNVTPAENELSGSISGTKLLDANTVYTITGPVIVEENGVLDIPAGTVIKAKKGFNSYILVLQGGDIYVRGTAEKPVTMTADIANAQQGHWGGLIINGYAPLTKDETGKNQVGSTEIYSAYIYGGDQPADKSGEITYLKLEYTGARSNANVEHNGLTLNGVGSGTVIKNIFIPNGADDGIEFFGGSVNVENLLVVNSDDDMFDFTQGYNGTLTNAYGIWEADFVSSEKDPRGIEADGNLDGEYAGHSNQSNFKVNNVTFDIRLAPNTTDKFYQMHDVIKVRRGARAEIVNALVKGTATAIDLIDIKDDLGAGDATSKISLTTQLTNNIVGKQINAEGTPTNIKIESGNTGCPTNIFAWTGYTAF